MALSEQDFNMRLGKIASEDEEGMEFAEKVKEMMAMLDDSDCDDYFGTEGWRRNFGWEN